jgi:hypothetical protein
MRALLWVLAALALAAPSSAGARGFEGELKGYVTVPGMERLPMNILVKGNNYQSEFFGVTSIHVDGRDRDIIMNAPRKIYAEVDGKKAEAQAKADLDRYEIRPTGRSEVIGKRLCKLWEMREKGNKTMVNEVWISQELPGAFNFSVLSGGKGGKSWLSYFEGRQGIPMRVAVREGERSATVMEFESVVAKPVDDAVFGIPEGYKRASALSVTLAGLGGAKEAPKGKKRDGGDKAELKGAAEEEPVTLKSEVKKSVGDEVRRDVKDSVFRHMRGGFGF